MKAILLTKVILEPFDINNMIIELVSYISGSGEFIIGIGSPRFKHIERVLFRIIGSPDWYQVISYSYRGDVISTGGMQKLVLPCNSEAFANVLQYYWSKELYLILEIKNEYNCDK